MYRSKKIQKIWELDGVFSPFYTFLGGIFVTKFLAEKIKIPNSSLRQKEANFSHKKIPKIAISI